MDDFTAWVAGPTVQSNREGITTIINEAGGLLGHYLWRNTNTPFTVSPLPLPELLHVN